jgi:hypothetical protein
VQIVQKNWKAVGIEVDLKLKETGAFLASALSTWSTSTFPPNRSTRPGGRLPKVLDPR